MKKQSANPLQKMHARIALGILEEPWGSELRGVVVQQDVGTGTHALMATVAGKARRLLGWRTLVVLSSPMLITYALAEYEKHGGGGQAAEFKSGAPYVAQADYVVTTKHAARALRLAERVKPDHFQMVIFGDVAAWSLDKLKQTGAAFAGARLHLLWSPYGKVRFTVPVTGDMSMFFSDVPNWRESLSL